MDTTEISLYCLSKAKTCEDYPFGDFPICYKVGGKIFAQLYPDKITLKCTKFSGEAFRQAYPGIVVRGYHCPPVQQPYWNTVDLARFPAEELPYMIDHAYETVVSSLPKKVQCELIRQLRAEGVPSPGGEGGRAKRGWKRNGEVLRVGKSPIQSGHLRIPARIPLQSAARTSHADSFPPGEAIGDPAPVHNYSNYFFIYGGNQYGKTHGCHR